MKEKFKFIIKIFKVKKKMSINVKMNDELISLYLQDRDTLINDKIYTDPVELVFMKSIHNAAVRKSCKELLFDMSKCDTSVANAVKPLMEEITQLKNDRSELKNELINQKKKSEELETQIALLLKNSNLI